MHTLRVAIGIGVVAFAARASLALTVTGATHSASPQGTELTVSGSLAFSGPESFFIAYGLPSGWTYVEGSGTASGGSPFFAASGSELSCFFFGTPTSPLSYSFRLLLPSANAAGLLVGEVQYADAGGNPQPPIPIGEGLAFPRYALTVANGSGDGAYAAGTRVPILADPPAADHAFDAWSDDAGGDFDDLHAASTHYTMPAGAAGVTAHYVSTAAPTQTFVVASSHGQPVPAVGSHPFARGSVLACQVPGVETLGATQYVCTGWVGAGSVPPSGSSTNVSVTLTSNSSIAWQWATNHWLDVAVAGGAASTSVTSFWYRAGSSVTVTAYPGPGVALSGWLVDGQPLGAAHASAGFTNAANWLRVPMQAAHAVTAAFANGDLGAAVDNTELLWSTTGSAPWVVTLGESSDGSDAAVSGALPDEGTSRLATAVTGPGTLIFVWRVSSEEDYDWLDFLVDGVPARMLTGESGWQSVTQRVAEGVHAVVWEYWKDKSDSGGSDCAWLDQVVWTPDEQPLAGFALWAHSMGMLGTAASLFGQDRNCDGVPNALEYAFGTNLPPGSRLLNIHISNGRPVVETPAQDAATLPYVEVRVLGSTNLTDWTLPVAPALDTVGKPANRAWHEPQGAVPNRAFFKLEATLK